jgi:putative endonuclease
MKYFENSEAARVAQGRLGPLERVMARLFKPSLGVWGEWVALGYLRRLGWDIIARNWKAGREELDLVAYDPTTPTAPYGAGAPFLVFVEVKTKMVPSALPPEDQIGRRKEETLSRLIDDFSLRYEVFDCPVRLDVIAIETEDLVSYQLRHYLAW